MCIPEILIKKTIFDYGRGFTGSTDCFCSSRDIFSARLDSFIRETTKYLEGAIIGEIGNNTLIISGRAPEQRGNGLKFVRASILDNRWSLYFQSGNGCCRLGGGSTIFTTALSSISGCLAIVNFGKPDAEKVV
ncbi:MAG: hypothetical protein Q8O15_07280 [Rectinemataceae bacterium]|nr:hypothetical protein [Rectinemataceae bacterium]